MFDCSGIKNIYFLFSTGNINYLFTKSEDLQGRTFNCIPGEINCRKSTVFTKSKYVDLSDFKQTLTDLICCIP